MFNNTSVHIQEILYNFHCKYIHGIIFKIQLHIHIESDIKLVFRIYNWILQE